MTTTSNSTKSSAKLLGHKAQQAVAKPWVQWLVRLGYVVRGLVYCTIGLLALQLAIGAGGATTGRSGAIALLSQSPLGKPLLVVIAAGLLGYSLWGFIRAILDPFGRGTEPKALIERFGYLFSGLSYGALALPILLSLVNRPSGAASGDDPSAQLLTKPFGPWLVVGLGIFWIVLAFAQVYTAYKATFTRELKTSTMSAQEIRAAKLLGRIGYTARGIVFGLTGWFILQTAIMAGPQRMPGFSGTLDEIAHAPYGSLLLSVVAIGLVLFGVHSFVMANWHYISSRKSA